MTLTPRETDMLLSIMQKIREQVDNPDRKKYKVENMCDRATAILKNAKRRKWR